MTALSAMRCVVIGAGGFIGTNLCRELAGKVYSLRGFGRRQSFPDALKGIDWIPGDFNDSAAVAAAISGADIVIHLISGSTPASSNVDKIADLKSNVIPTLQLLEACRQEKVRRVIFISSGGTVYGLPEEIPTPETAPLNPICAYGISKLAIEKYLALYKHLYGLDYLILRVANPYGPYQTALRNQGVIGSFLSRIGMNKPIEIWGDGSVCRDYIYIDDVVDAIRLAMVYTGSSCVFNIGSGIGSNLNQILETIKTVTDKVLDVHYLNGRDVDVPKSVLDVSLAKQELNWQPKKSLLEGLAKTATWHLQNHH
jgi:UDP-glucose 4-epimerase